MKVGGTCWIRTSDRYESPDAFLAGRCCPSLSQRSFSKVAGLVRFELTEGFPSSVFKTGAISRSATNPWMGPSCQQLMHVRPDIRLTIAIGDHKYLLCVIPIPESPDVQGSL